MDPREKLLKSVYTAGALLLGGALYFHLLPEQASTFADGALTYLVLHSWLPSAKKPGQQG